MENHSLEISRPEQPLEGFPDPQFVFFFFSRKKRALELDYKLYEWEPHLCPRGAQQVQGGW